MGEREAEAAFLEMRNLIVRLRSEEGCPWDKEQTVATLAPHLREEVEEAIAEVETESWDALKKELGDVFLIILLMIQTAEEEGLFDMESVLRSGCEKIVRRHPHVFNGLKVNSIEDIIDNWRRIKEEEKRGGK